MTDSLEPLQAVYSVAEPNVPILLGTEAIEMHSGANGIVGAAQVYLRLLPKPRIVVEATFEDDVPTMLRLMHDDKKPAIEFPSRSFQCEMIVTSVHMAATGLWQIVASPEKEPMTMPPSVENLTEVILHLLNFHDFIAHPLLVEPEPGDHRRLDRVVLEADSWRVTLDSQLYTKRNIDSLRGTGGYAVTHIGKIARTSGVGFTVDEVRDVLQRLCYFFSFARGFWAPPILPIGFSPGMEQVWEEWGTPLADSWQGVLSWCDAHHCDELAGLFPGFWRRWGQPLWKEAIRSAIYWYLRSNTLASGTDGSIILSQAALELLAWVFLVEENHSLSKDGFKRLSAADKFRLLLHQLGIPLNIPSALGELVRLAGPSNWTDGPQALTGLRNRIVHPESKRPRVSFSRRALIDGWNLGQWYLELILLRLFDYQGKYGDRLKEGRWVGDVSQVPWAT